MPCTMLHPVKTNTWSVAELAGSVTAIGGSMSPVPAWPLPSPDPSYTHPIVCCAAYVLAGLASLTEYRYPSPSPINIRPAVSSTTGAVNTVLYLLVETVTGQLPASLTSAGAPPPNTGVIL